MQNQVQQEMTISATASIRLFKTKINQGDEINCAGWKENFERHHRLLNKCGVSNDDALMIELAEIITSLSPEDDDELPDQVTEALGGRDIMLTSVDVLERVRDAHRGRVGDYLDGVISARLSLRAAGVETVA